MIIRCVKTGYLEENCYVISKGDKCLIVDPGDDFYKIEELVGEKEVLAILITHYHEDHIGALEDCIKKYNGLFLSSFTTTFLPFCTNKFFICFVVNPSKLVLYFFNISSFDNCDKFT